MTACTDSLGTTDDRPRAKKAGPIAALLLALLGGYRRWVSGMLGQHCRFHPSCSAYAIDAVTEYGALRGCGLALRRLARCQPFSPGGYDPVPARKLGASR